MPPSRVDSSQPGPGVDPGLRERVAPVPVALLCGLKRQRMARAAAKRKERMNPNAPLSAVEARVLGVLVEKEKTVPDIYPLSLNALTAGCNQKNNRDPVMNCNDAEVQAALDELKHRTLVIESSGSRVMRYSHNAARALRVPEQTVALLAALLLRGPQTAGELRIATERLHRFADISSVEAFLEELAARGDAQGGALVARLPRHPGEREQRWAQLLTGAPPAGPQPAGAPPADDGDLARQVRALAAEVEQLRAELASLRESIAPGQR
jgi:hypothetical protein